MDFIEILLGAMQDPITYSIIFFIYVILAAVILPIPVEIGLFNSSMHPLLLIGILAIGKGVGASIAFEIGSKIRTVIKKRSFSVSLTVKIVAWCERFVIKYGYYGLFIIMSTPLMIDSASLYLFSLLNAKYGRKQALTRQGFILINIAAGAVRGAIIIVVASLFQIRLV